MGHYLRLTREKIDLAIAKGKERESRHVSRRGGYDSAQIRTRDPDAVGIKGEGAVAEYFGVWDEWIKGAGAKVNGRLVDYDAVVGDVVFAGIQVRSTYHAHGGLLIRYNKADLIDHINHRFLLVRVLPDRWFDIVGWQYGYVCTTTEFLKPPGSLRAGERESCWLVPGHKLEPPESVRRGTWTGTKWQ